MTETPTHTFERGDTVFHRPTGETWLLLRVTERHVYPAGWPPSAAPAEDCDIVEKATPGTLAWLDEVEREHVDD